MENKRILVIGGTGYIGMPLVDKLVDNGYDVTLLVRSENNIKKMNSQYQIINNTNYFIGDLLDKKSLNNIKNFDIIINLASIVRTTKKERYKENIISLQNLIDVMKKNKIPKIIYFSSQNVLLKNKGYYGKSKEECENILKKSNIEYVIIRPNHVYGIDKNNDFYKLGYIIRHLNIAPIIGTGNYRIQPVLIDDLVSTTLDILKFFKAGLIVEVSGTTISMNEIVELMGKYLKKHPLIIHIPINILKLFESFIPFDVFDEDKISRYSFGYSSSFEANLKKILDLT